MITFHPLAELFPLMTGEDFAALVADIRAHGQCEPIILYEGKILDGRNRYRACQEAGLAPVTEEYAADEDPRAYVISKNLHRRHLNETQRALIAAKLATRQKQDTLVPGGMYGKLDAGKPTSSLSVQQAADLLNVTKNAVSNAKALLRAGSEEQIKAVKAGKAGLESAARAARGNAPRARYKPHKVAHSGKNPERLEKLRVNAEVCGRLKDALLTLTGLPHPADVARISRGLDRHGVIDAKLDKAIKWLGGFKDEWSNSGRDA